jgi:hypothetical protein
MLLALCWHKYYVAIDAAAFSLQCAVWELGMVWFGTLPGLPAIADRTLLLLVYHTRCT